MKNAFFCFLVILVALFPKPTFAQQEALSANNFITVVNPIRISAYSTNPKDSLAVQYSEVQKRNLAATWLLSYDAILDPGIVSVAKRMDKAQELGLFLEITPLFSSSADVIYNKTDSWHTTYIPAIFANKRDYVRQATGKDIVYNASIFNAKTRPEAKRELDKLNADYIYLVRFEDYTELAPFSPGDLNIEEVYSNANTQIWKVKKS